ncbi:TlpA family protein disulfide reductase [Hyunsoonleella pacifica]|uniref:TlpA family protein disulfide reductase n=1 Tax=Hyunsoonleella pacifica TaxID=1080224 RepID=A0A4Q9FKK5_9FLAO|nr:TlpA disulfide reductase family protein [Hyunsoonleella pacifica]TBN13145.1 TlpA family protein disulfide reductase [Hyunsoonleella pacifica]GGD28533.1 alkyl hydroperoxide reductase [Hyunsoonleella pacifica]
MKKISYLLLMLLSYLSCAEPPTQFDEAALNDTFITLEGSKVTLQSILEKHKGKTIVIDIWASWCGDCIRGMPKVKALQKEYTDVVYLFFSLDKGIEAWKRGIKRYNVEGEHYYLPKAKKSAFGDFVNISWIPRYMVINKASEIVVFNVIEADDNKLIKALKN